MPLTPKQKEELHKEILDYLKTAGFLSTAEIFQKETEVEELDSKKSGLLEKKMEFNCKVTKKGYGI